MTPFQYLRQNINNIKFDCETVYIPEYKRALSAVLDKMDKAFIKNGWYDVVDYQPIVEEMLASSKVFSFYIDDEISKRHWAGVHRRHNNDTRRIGMGKEYMGRNTTTEGVLCHELIHQLTLGPKTLTYSKDGDRYETQLPVRTAGLVLGGMKRNVTKRTAQGLEAGSALDGGFICEAFTELVKQEIYSEEECFHSYPAQTSLIKFLNTLTGTKINYEDFLRGDLPNYIKILGRKNFEEFNKHCEAFQLRNNANAYLYHLEDPDYLAAQGLICDLMLQKITENPEQYTTADFVRIASAIMTEAPSAKVDPNFTKKYTGAILRAANAITSIQPLEYAEKQKFSALLRSTLDRTVQQQKSVYEIPAQGVDFAVKKTATGFAINFQGGQFISSDVFPKHYSSAVKAKVGTAEFTIELSEQGTYQISATTPNGQPQVIKIVPSRISSGELLIQDAQSKDIFKLNFAREDRKRTKAIQENIALLTHFDHYDDVKDVLKDNAGYRVYSVKQITTPSGEEYLVANSSKTSMFYRITPNGYRRVDVVDQQTPQQNTAIRTKITTGRDEATSMVGYMATGETTDEYSISFKLSDGSTFVRYFDNSGVEQFGQQIYPYTGATSSVIVPVENPTLFSSTNEDMADLASTATTYAAQGIQREVPHRDMLAEKKVADIEQAKRVEAERIRQAENSRKIEEQRMIEGVTQTEAEKRQRRIEEERVNQRQAEAQKEERYRQLEEKAKERGQINDNFSGGINRTRNQQFVGYGR